MRTLDTRLITVESSKEKLGRYSESAKGRNKVMKALEASDVDESVKEAIKFLFKKLT